MATQTLNYCSAVQLGCGSTLPASAVICVPAFIVFPTPTTVNGYVNATITAVRDSTCADACGPCKWVYTITYDDTQLISGYLLVSAYINEILCDNCLIDFILANASTVTATFCWNLATTETELIALNNAGVGGIAIGATVTLTGDLTVTIPLTVLPCGNVVTNGHTLTLNKFTPAGIAPYFSNTTGVIFREGSLDTVYLEWFGAVGDGTTNDCDAYRTAIKSYHHITMLDKVYNIGATAASGDFLLYLGIAGGNTDRSGVTIEGTSQLSTVRLADNAGANRLLFSTATGDSLKNATFKNFTVDCNGANNLQVNFGDPLRYNSAFYLASYCENIRFEDLTVKNISGSQGIRVGADTGPTTGLDIYIVNCRFLTFGRGIPSNNIQDISVLYIEADNILIEGSTFRNVDHSFDLSRGETAIELHSKNSTKVSNNVFEYVQLPILLASPDTAALNTLIDGNTFTQTNYLASLDATATGNDQSRIIITNNAYFSTKVMSQIILIGVGSEGAKNRAQIQFVDNVLEGTGNTNQGTHVFRIEDVYVNNLVIQDNDIKNFLGGLLYLSGTALPNNTVEIKIINNRLDSLGPTAGGFPNSPFFVFVSPTANTVKSLIIDGNDVYNTLAKNYSSFGIWRRNGNITYSYINDTKNHVSSTYPLITGTLTANTFKFENYFPRDFKDNLFPYLSGNIALGATTNVNIADFSAYTVGQVASFLIQGTMDNGATVGIAVWQVTVCSTGNSVNLLSSSGGYAADIQFNFSAGVLRMRNNSAGVTTGRFVVQTGYSTLPVNWLY